MPRDIEEPAVNEHGFEEHPAFGNIVVNRAHSTPGAVLFDSDIRHEEIVYLRIAHAERKRDLKSDWIHARDQIVEIQMSLAQWASMVSSFGNGSGTSCTITTMGEVGLVPGIPFAPRMAQSMAETREAAHEAYDEIKVAFDAYVANKNKTTLRKLQAMIENAVPNVEFAGKQLTRYTEETVQRARADIEAMVTRHARTLGIDSASVTGALALETGEEGS